MRTLWNHFLRTRWIAVCSFIFFSPLLSARISAPSIIHTVSASTGSLLGGEEVVITGKSLYRPKSVTFGGVPATIVSSGVAFINVVTPPHALGAVDVVVLNSGGYTTVAKNVYTYTIGITPSSLSDGIPGISYSQTLQATGGIAPYHWSVVTGSLPSGLQLGSGTGEITGIPAANYETYAFTLQVEDSSSPRLIGTFSLSITIDIGLKPGPIPASFFGMSVIDPGNWPSISFGAFGKGGETTWSYVEPVKGQFNWTRLDAFVANAKAHGKTLFWTSQYVPQWAAKDPSTCSAPNKEEICTSTVANIADWDDFCTALVQRYKGRILMYELWNEPDGTDFTGTVADMVELAQHFYAVVRDNDPGALIASPSAIHATWLSSYFASGGPTGVDVISTHGYLENAGNVPEALEAAKAVGWHDVMLQYGLANKPLWDTESSWGPDVSAGLDPDAEAAFLARDYVLHWSDGMTVFYWYAFDSPLWGTLWSSGGVNKAGLAYTQVYKWMTGATMPEPCAMEGTVYTCSLTRPNGYRALAVWDSSKTCTTAGGCSTSNYTAPQYIVQYRDLIGGVSTIQTSQVLLIGAKPILLENQEPPNQ